MMIEVCGRATIIQRTYYCRRNMEYACFIQYFNIISLLTVQWGLFTSSLLSSLSSWASMPPFLVMIRAPSSTPLSFHGGIRFTLSIGKSTVHQSELDITHKFELIHLSHQTRTTSRPLPSVDYTGSDLEELPPVPLTSTDCQLSRPIMSFISGTELISDGQARTCRQRIS